MSFFARNLQIFKRIGLPLYVLHLIYVSLDQYLTTSTEAILRSAEGMTRWVWIYGMSSLLVGILFPILGILVIIYGAKEKDPNESGLWDFVHTYLSQLFREILRSWGKTLLWSLLFILPGIWKYLQYLMIPFVVTLSKAYDRGELDALQASAAVAKGNLLKVLAVLLVFHLFLPMVLTVLFDDYRVIWNTPVSAAALTLLDMYLFIFSTQLLLTIFEKQTQEVPHAAAHV